MVYKKLWDCIRMEEDELAITIIENFEDLTVRDLDGNTALMQALLYGRHTVVDCLLSKMNDVTQINDEGDDAFHFAILHVDIPTLTMMIEKGADINNYNDEGTTALMLLAMRESREQKIDFLIQHGVNLHVESKYGQTALGYAIEYQIKNNVDKILHATKDINELFASKKIRHHMIYNHTLYRWIEEREKELSKENLRIWKTIRLKKMFM